MTKKLFYQDSHIREFTATVTACRERGEYYEVVLDRTAFFPEGGGQYADTGKLGAVQVTDVKERQGVIYHLTSTPLEEGREIRGEIDWDMRFMKMQQHTGEHIVSGLVNKRLGYHNVGFHLGNLDCTMDFDREIQGEELRELEHLVNECVFQNLEVQVTYPSREELSSLEYRSKIEIEGQVRIVEIPGYDVCACCAPHVKRTGEIGLVKLTNVQRYKGGARVTMLCGYRALADYRQKEQHVKSICGLLSSKEGDASQAVKRVQEECAFLRENLAQKQKKLLYYRAQEVEQQGIVTCLFERDLVGDEPRLLTNMMLERGIHTCIVFQYNEENSWRYVIGSKVQDVRPFAKELNERFSGRGGGKSQMAQGFLKGEEGTVREWIEKKGRET